MSVYISVRLTTNLVCDCAVYKFPHAPSKGLCKVPVPPIDTVPYKLSSQTALKIYYALNENHRQKSDTL
jgi:hypothetical protein